MEKKLNTKDFWAVTQISWITCLSASPSSCRRAGGERLVRLHWWRTQDASRSKGCSDKIGDREVWRGAAGTYSQTGTDLSLLLSASVCCSPDKQQKWKSTFCWFPKWDFQAWLSYNIIKELEVVLSRVWFQAASGSDRGALVRKQKIKFVNCTWLKENQKTWVIFPNSSLP